MRIKFNSRAEKPSLLASASARSQDLHSLALHVDVLRLVAVETVKEEPVWAGNVLDGGH
jgi:hypothetical protein